MGFWDSTVNLLTLPPLVPPPQAGPAELAALAHRAAQEAARLDAMAAAFDAYKGSYHGKDNHPLPKAEDGVDDAIVVNRMKTIVDTATFFLFGQPPRWALPSADTADPTAESENPIETWLTECLRVGKWPIFLQDLRTNGGVSGTAYARVLPPAPPRYPYPRVQAIDPTCMVLLWHPRDVTEITAYCWQANSMDLATGRPILIRQVITALDDGVRWRILDQQADLRGITRTWQTTGDTIWSHAWAPILAWPNLPCPNEIYGAPDITENLIHLNQNLNRNLTNRGRVDRYQGHPYLFASGFNGAALDIRPDHFNILPSPDSKTWQLAPTLNTDATEQLARELNAAMDEESQTPAITRGRTDVANPSGVALRIQFWPMDAKIAALRAVYGPALIELLRRLCELGGHGPDQVADLTWPDLLPVDVLARAQALQAEQAMGTTSKATLAGALNRDWPTEQANLAAEVATMPAPPVQEQPSMNPNSTDAPQGQSANERLPSP